MKYVQTKTIKVRRTTVFLLLVLIMGLIMVTSALYGFINGTSQPSPKSVPAEYFEGMELIQLKPPADGLKKAVISTSAGDMTAVLYSEQAPEAVRRFTEECAGGAYNGANAIIYDEGAVFSLDSPSEEAYSPELDKNLWPFKGALCMTEKGDIVFINTIDLSEEDREYLLSDSSVLKDVSRAFADVGGVPNYARVYAVFGQVTEGIEVIEKIAVSDGETAVINSISVS